MSNDKKKEPGFGPAVAPGDSLPNDVPDAKEQESPDFLATPKRGKGVRRLNRIPLLVVGGMVALTVLGVSYTLYQRQQAQFAKSATPAEQPALAASAAPPVRPGDGEDLIAGPPPPSETVIGDKTAAPGQPAQQAAASAEPSEAYKRRLENIQRIEERRLSMAEQAIGAEGTVSTFNNRNGSAGAGGQQQAGSDLSGPARAAAAGQKMQDYLAAMQQPSGGGFGSGMDGGGPGSGGNGQDMATANRQPQKQAFLAGTPDADTYLAAQRKAAVAMSQEVKAGTIIPGVMISGLNSDLPGQIIGQVRENVFDSATGTQLLIPAGSRLVGTYDSGVTLGQKRALIGWSRIIYPDSSSISLDKMPGADLSGYAGFKDKVDNHYWRIFGSGLLLSVFSAGIQLSQPQSSGDTMYDNRQIVAGELGREMGQLGMEITRRNMQIQPTIEIRPGYQFNVMVTKDIILPTWQGHPMASR